MSFEHSLRRGTPFGFVPKKLKIKGHSEFNIFPFNILFASYKKENGKTIMGYALYESDLSSFKDEDNKLSMYYHNGYGGNSWVLIEYNTLNNNYFGKKTVNNKSAGTATGKEWKMFFVHLTSLGLEDGEKCLFKPI